MAVINRTPDSFFDHGATYELGAALAAADRAVADGADILDIGGVKAGPGDEVSAAEEIRRVAGLVAAVRARHPGSVISVDTWRARWARRSPGPGADLLNDPWGGADPALVQVAASHGAGLVCSHAGGLAPRTRPHRPAYADVVAEMRAASPRQAERAVAAGVRADRIVIDPAHDFGKNTWHSLQLTRRTADLVATGWPVLAAVSNKDFVGETLGLPGQSGPRARSRRWPCARGRAPGCSGFTMCGRPGRPRRAVTRSARWAATPAGGGGSNAANMIAAMRSPSPRAAA